jgi:hypothetical protein
MSHRALVTFRLRQQRAAALVWIGLVSAGHLLAGTVQLTAIGSPTWTPVDFQVFSAPVGTAASGYVEFALTTLSVLPTPNHEASPVLNVGPGAPHDPPYDSEISAGVAAQGYHEGNTFSPAEFSNGQGVFFAWMTIPSPGAMGSSPDFGAGPVIPNSLFPIHVAGSTLRNGSAWNPFLTAFDVPALDASVDPRFAAIDGHSHFAVFVADNADFGPPGGSLYGSYVYRVEMLDNAGNGWSVEASFQVVPEPWTFGMAAMSLALLLLFRRRSYRTPTH